MKKLIVVIGSFSLLCLSTLASEQIESNRLITALQKAQELTKRYSKQNILVAFDLDDTLLTMSQDIGSEHWFEWQAGLLSAPKNPQRVACDFPDLLELYSLLISLSRTQLTQNDSSSVVSQLQQEGFSTLILTSRGPIDSNGTVRELGRHGIDMKKGAIGQREGFALPFLPFDPKEPQKSGLSVAEVQKFKLEKAKPVAYQGGIFLGEGQHKGIMLKTFLQKMKHPFQAIVFVDNLKRNTDRVYEVMAKETDLTTIRFSGMDDGWERFSKSGHDKATQDYLALRKVLQQTFGYKRPCPLPIDGAM